MHCVDLGESFPTSIYFQKLASIQPRTGLVKFARSPCTDPQGANECFRFNRRCDRCPWYFSRQQRLRTDDLSYNLMYRRALEYFEVLKSTLHITDDQATSMFGRMMDAVCGNGFSCLRLRRCDFHQRNAFSEREASFGTKSSTRRASNGSSSFCKFMN